MTPPPPLRPRRSAVDGVAAAVLSAFAALAALGSVGFSLFFVMATDGVVAAAVLAVDR